MPGKIARSKGAKLRRANPYLLGIVDTDPGTHAFHCFSLDDQDDDDNDNQDAYRQSQSDCK